MVTLRCKLLIRQGIWARSTKVGIMLRQAQGGKWVGRVWLGVGIELKHNFLRY